MTRRLVIVAGEPSGDLLAARVMQGLQAIDPEVDTQGIGGPIMQRAGFRPWYPMDALSVFGYVDALKRAPGLLRIWRGTRRRILRDPPAAFIGVDAPDFNLRLERHVREAGIPTVHFVSPSIWAWRYERIHQIRKAVSHMLVLFPFEEALYQQAGVPVTYVGHPLAQVIPAQPDRARARARLGLADDQRVLALLPGSRESEIRLLAPAFLQAASRLQDRDPDLQIVVPLINAARQRQFEAIRAQFSLRNCHLLSAPSDGEAGAVTPAEPSAGPVDDASRTGWPVAWHAMEAADAVLVASGTATLEAALFKRPMVIAYRLSPWMRRLMAWQSGQQAPSMPWVGLPNILAQTSVVPELLQEQATPAALAEHCWQALCDPDQRARVQAQFRALHQSLHRDTPRLAAQAIWEVCDAHAR